MKKLLITFCILSGMMLPAWGQRPTTHVAIYRPTTQVSVSRPQTAVNVFRPTTSVGVSRPNTQINVSRPETQVAVSRPTTQTDVFRPTTVVNVSKPASLGGSSAAAPSSSVKKAAVPSSQAQTSMSGYKPPQAKEFKAPSVASSLGGGAEGLGNKVNQAEKALAAAASQAPKATDPSGVSTQAIVGGSSDQKAGGKSLLDLLKQKAAGRSASK